MFPNVEYVAWLRQSVGNFEIRNKSKMSFKYVIRRIFHGLWLGMSFIELVMCFLSSIFSVENLRLFGLTPIPYATTNHGIPNTCIVYVSVA